MKGIPEFINPEGFVHCSREKIQIPSTSKKQRQVQKTKDENRRNKRWKRDDPDIDSFQVSSKNFS